MKRCASERRAEPDIHIELMERLIPYGIRRFFYWRSQRPHMLSLRPIMQTRLALHGRNYARRAADVAPRSSSKVQAMQLQAQAAPYAKYMDGCP